MTEDIAEGMNRESGAESGDAAAVEADALAAAEAAARAEAEAAAEEAAEEEAEERERAEQMELDRQAGFNGFFPGEGQLNEIGGFSRPPRRHDGED